MFLINVSIFFKNITSANDLNRNIETLIELASGLTFIIYLPVKEFVLLQHKTFLSALIFLKLRHLIHFFI